MSNVERFANEAVRVLQFNSVDAIRYIQRNAGVDYKSAVDALKAELLFYKK
jgi:hypothetical protein